MASRAVERPRWAPRCPSDPAGQVLDAGVTNSPGMTQPWILDRPASPPRRTWTPLVLTQLVVVVAVLLAGVVSAGVVRDSAPTVDVLKVVQAASSSTSSAKTFRATFEMVMDFGTTHVKVTGETLADLATKRSSSYFEMPPLGRMNVVQIGPRGFFQIPGGRTDAAGHHWVAVTVPGGSAQAALGGQDPAAFFKLLADPKDVSSLGQERVNGTDTTHYRVKLDPQRLADAGAKALGTPIPAGALDQIKNLGMDVWIDGDNRARRMTMGLKVGGGSVQMTMNVLDYDGAVTVTEPAHADVTQLANLSELGPVITGLLHN